MLRTCNPRIFATGDVCLAHKFTNTAQTSARIVVSNALFLGRQRMSALTIPWCTYTDPEVAHVGMYVKGARQQRIPVKTFTIPMHDVDRAVADGEEEEFVKVHVREGSDKILGATVVARHAGQMINSISLAMVADIGLQELASVVHAYPTQGAAIRQAADAYVRTRQTPLLHRVALRCLQRQSTTDSVGRWSDVRQRTDDLAMPALILRTSGPDSGLSMYCSVKEQP